MNGETTLTRELALGIAAGFLLFLVPLVVFAVLRLRRSVRAAPVREDLARTHEQIRRYTADLERAHAHKEKRLAEITLLHRFGEAVHQERHPEGVYSLALSFAREASEARHLFLAHRRGAEGRTALRAMGDAPGETQEWVRGRCSAAGERGDRRIEGLAVPGLGTCSGVAFRRHPGEESCVILLLLFPARDGGLEEDRLQVVSMLMNRVESGLALLALAEELERANRRLSEGNAQLRALVELENEFSRAFLLRHGLPETFQTLNEIMAKEIFGVDRINLFLPNNAAGMLEAATSVGIGDYPLEKVKVPMDERGGGLALAFREGRPVSWDGRGPVPREYRLAEPFASIAPIRSRIFLIVPIVDHRGVVLGVIAADRKYSHQPIMPEAAMMLEAFARHTALLFSLRKEDPPCR